MPITKLGLGLGTFGLLATGGAVAAFRQKLTGPFKAAYFLAWPTLGSAILILGDPGYDGQKQVLEKAGRLDSEGQIPAEITDTKALAMQRMREAAQSTGRVA